MDKSLKSQSIEKPQSSKFVPKLSLSKIFLPTKETNLPPERSVSFDNESIPKNAKRVSLYEKNTYAPPLRTRVRSETIQQQITKDRKFKLEFIFTHNIPALKSLTKIQAIVRKRCVKKNYLKLKEKLKKRGFILKEILNSEKIFIENLKLCLKEFGEPMKTLPYINVNNWKNIFSNVEIILNVNNQLFSKLHERIEEKKQQNIGDIFMEMGAYLKVYTSYVNYYNNINEFLVELVSTQSQFRDFLGKMKELPVLKGQELQAFLIMPIQRLPR